jgi:hypothetical protein
VQDSESDFQARWGEGNLHAPDWVSSLPLLLLFFVSIGSHAKHSGTAWFPQQLLRAAINRHGEGDELANGDMFFVPDCLSGHHLPQLLKCFVNEAGGALSKAPWKFASHTCSPRP